MDIVMYTWLIDSIYYTAQPINPISRKETNTWEV